MYLTYGATGAQQQSISLNLLNGVVPIISGYSKIAGLTDVIDTTYTVPNLYIDTIQNLAAGSVLSIQLLNSFTGTLNVDTIPGIGVSYLIISKL
jgi:hypothetical protein